VRRPALEVDRLTVRDAGGRPLLHDVTVRVPQGGTLTLIGETGSGKSLIAQAVFGLLPRAMRAEGTIRVGTSPAIPAGDAKRLAALWRSHTMLVPQEPFAALDPVMRVGRQMALAGLSPSAVDAALGAVDLPAALTASLPSALSGGMAQRVLVATALGVGAPIIVADEPTKGLDDARRDQTVALLGRLGAVGRSLVTITHDRRVAAALGGTLAIVKDGRIVEQGDCEAVLSSPSSAYGRAWLEADPAHWPRRRRCCDMDRLALSAHGLAFAYPGAAPLFAKIDLHLPRGGVVAVTGPSGCGKSTLGNVLLGLARPTAGSVEWAGVDIVVAPSVIAARRRGYQKLHQDPGAAFRPSAPIRRQLAALETIVPGLRLDRDLPPLLDRLHLRPGLLERRPGEISGGEAQRLALARILLLAPVAIVADEPTSRLDPVVQRETIALLRDCVDEQGVGLLLISHDRALVGAVADEVLALG
jgi:peptide/nickel transport system ATP-binding protein